MLNNARTASEKSSTDYKLLMQIRNGHLNEGFNSRKPSSTSTKPISKYNILHSYFELNFSGEYSKRIAQEFKRQIKCHNKYKQMETSFIDGVRQKILYVHNYNLKVNEVTFSYPLCREFVELLMEYVLIECRALYRRPYYSQREERTVRDRILRLLLLIFNTHFETKMLPAKGAFEKSAKAIINLFIEIKRDCGTHNKLMEDMTIKLLKKTGHLEKIEALKGKNLPCPLDTYLADPEVSNIYKTIITSDYGTDDGYQVEDDVQILEDEDIVLDITTTTDSNEIKEEAHVPPPETTTTILPPSSGTVLTICLDDSDVDSDEETCCLMAEVKTSERSLQHQRRRLLSKKQQESDAFQKRNHRPLDEVKIEEEIIKVDATEELNHNKSDAEVVEISDDENEASSSSAFDDLANENTSEEVSLEDGMLPDASLQDLHAPRVLFSESTSLKALGRREALVRTPTDLLQPGVSTENDVEVISENDEPNSCLGGEELVVILEDSPEALLEVQETSTMEKRENLSSPVVDLCDEMTINDNQGDSSLTSDEILEEETNATFEKNDLEIPTPDEEEILLEADPSTEAPISSSGGDIGRLTEVKDTPDDAAELSEENTEAILEISRPPVDCDMKSIADVEDCCSNSTSDSQASNPQARDAEDTEFEVEVSPGSHITKEDSPPDMKSIAVVEDCCSNSTSDGQASNPQARDAEDTEFEVEVSPGSHITNEDSPPDMKSIADVEDYCRNSTSDDGQALNPQARDAEDTEFEVEVSPGSHITKEDIPPNMKSIADVEDCCCNSTSDGQASKPQARDAEVEVSPGSYITKEDSPSKRNEEVNEAAEVDFEEPKAITSEESIRLEENLEAVEIKALQPLIVEELRCQRDETEESVQAGGIVEAQEVPVTEMSSSVTEDRENPIQKDSEALSNPDKEVEQWSHHIEAADQLDGAMSSSVIGDRENPIQKDSEALTNPDKEVDQSSYQVKAADQLDGAEVVNSNENGIEDVYLELKAAVEGGEQVEAGEELDSEVISEVEVSTEDVQADAEPRKLSDMTQNESEEAEDMCTSEDLATNTIEGGECEEVLLNATASETIHENATEETVQVPVVSDYDEPYEEHQLEFHNESEFALEVEVGTEEVKTRQDDGEKCHQFHTKQSHKEDNNLRRKIVDREYSFGQQELNIKPDDYLNHKCVDMKLLDTFKRNGIDIFVQKDGGMMVSPQKPSNPLDVLADVATNALREKVIEEQKPAKRGRPSKAAKNGLLGINHKKHSRKESKVDSAQKRLPKKVAKTSDRRVTRSNSLKTDAGVEIGFKPHDFLLSAKNSSAPPPPANKSYADRIADVNFTSEDSNDSECNKLMIDEGNNTKWRENKPKLLDQRETKVDEDVQQQFQECIGANKVDEVMNIYDEDTLDEDLRFCYTPKLKDTNNSVSQLTKEQTFDAAVLKDAEKTFLGKGKPFKTKAERKAYNQPGLNPYIRIERLEVGSSAPRVKRFARGAKKKSTVASSDRMGEKVAMESQEKAEIHEEAVEKVLSESEEKAEIHEGAGDVDEIPLSARVKIEAHGEAVVEGRKSRTESRKSKKSSRKQQKSAGNDAKAKTKDAKRTSAEDEQLAVKVASSSSNGKELEDDHTKQQNSECTQSKYHTLPKLRRKSMIKETSTAIFAGNEDKKCMLPPKSRGKSPAGRSEKLKEASTKLKWRCKNTVTPTTEKLMKKLFEKDSVADADVEQLVKASKKDSSVEEDDELNLCTAGVSLDSVVIEEEQLGTKVGEVEKPPVVEDIQADITKSPISDSLDGELSVPIPKDEKEVQHESCIVSYEEGQNVIETPAAEDFEMNQKEANEPENLTPSPDKACSENKVQMANVPEPESFELQGEDDTQLETSGRPPANTEKEVAVDGSSTNYDAPSELVNGTMSQEDEDSTDTKCNGLMQVVIEGEAGGKEKERDEATNDIPNVKETQITGEAKELEETVADAILLDTELVDVEKVENPQVEDRKVSLKQKVESCLKKRTFSGLFQDLPAKQTVDKDVEEQKEARENCFGGPDKLQALEEENDIFQEANKPPKKVLLIPNTVAGFIDKELEDVERVENPMEEDEKAPLKHKSEGRLKKRTFSDLFQDDPAEHTVDKDVKEQTESRENCLVEAEKSQALEEENDALQEANEPPKKVLLVLLPSIDIKSEKPAVLVNIDDVKDDKAVVEDVSSCVQDFIVPERIVTSAVEVSVQPEEELEIETSEMEHSSCEETGKQTEEKLHKKFRYRSKSQSEERKSHDAREETSGGEDDTALETSGRPPDTTEKVRILSEVIIRPARRRKEVTVNGNSTNDNILTLREVCKSQSLCPSSHSRDEDICEVSRHESELTRSSESIPEYESVAVEQKETFPETEFRSKASQSVETSLEDHEELNDGNNKTELETCLDVKESSDGQKDSTPLECHEKLDDGSSKIELETCLEVNESSDGQQDFTSLGDHEEVDDGSSKTELETCLGVKETSNAQKGSTSLEDHEKLDDVSSKNELETCLEVNESSDGQQDFTSLGDHEEVDDGSSKTELETCLEVNESSDGQQDFTSLGDHEEVDDGSSKTVLETCLEVKESSDGQKDSTASEYHEKLDDVSSKTELETCLEVNKSSDGQQDFISLGDHEKLDDSSSKTELEICLEVKETSNAQKGSISLEDQEKLDDSFSKTELETCLEVKESSDGQQDFTLGDEIEQDLDLEKIEEVYPANGSEQSETSSALDYSKPSDKELSDTSKDLFEESYLDDKDKADENLETKLPPVIPEDTESIQGSRSLKADENFHNKVDSEEAQENSILKDEKTTIESSLTITNLLSSDNVQQDSKEVEQTLNGFKGVQTEVDIYNSIIEAESICVSNEVELSNDVADVVDEKVNDTNDHETFRDEVLIAKNDAKKNKETILNETLLFLNHEKQFNCQSFFDTTSNKVDLTTAAALPASKEAETKELEAETLKILAAKPETIVTNILTQGSADSSELNNELIVSQNRKRKRTITVELDSLLDELKDSNARKYSTMKELSVLIDNSKYHQPLSSSSPKKRERKSIETVVNHLKEKENITSSLVGAENVCSVSSLLRTEDIPDIHSEVTVSSVAQDVHVNNSDLLVEDYTSSFESGFNTVPSIEDIAAPSGEDIAAPSDEDINPEHYHFIPSEEMFDVRQSTDLSLNTSTGNDAAVVETLRNLRNLKRFGKTTFVKLQTSTSSVVRTSFIASQSGDKSDFMQKMPLEGPTVHNNSSLGIIQADGSEDFTKFERLIGFTSAISERVSTTITTATTFTKDQLNYQDISPSKISMGSSQTLDLISTQNYQTVISRSNSFNGASNEITDIIPQYTPITEIKVSYDGNSDHNYFHADPVMSIAGEDIFPKGISDASSELPSNDNPLRDLDLLPDDFSEFLNANKQDGAEEKDVDEKDPDNQDHHQTDDYKLRIDNETIAQNLVEIAQQSKEIDKLYDLLDCDISVAGGSGGKLEGNYAVEQSRHTRSWENIMEADQSTQKVIVVPNNQCLTPTFTMSHTDLFNSFDAIAPTASCCSTVKADEVAGPSLATLTSSTAKKDAVETKRPNKITSVKTEKPSTADVLPTRSYSRTRPAKWIKSSSQPTANNSKVAQAVKKTSPKATVEEKPSTDVVSTDNLLELSLTKPVRQLKAEEVSTLGPERIPTSTKSDVAAKRDTEACGPSLATNHLQPRSDSERRSSGLRLYAKLNERKPEMLSASSLCVPKDIIGEAYRKATTTNSPKEESVVRNIADIVKSRKRVATNLYSSYAAEEMRSGSHSRSKRRKTPPENTKSPLVETLSNSYSSRCKPEEAELKVRLKMKERCPSDYSIDRLLGPSGEEGSSSRKRDLKRSSSGSTEAKQRKTEPLHSEEDPFDRLLRQKNVNPFFTYKYPHAGKSDYVPNSTASYRSDRSDKCRSERLVRDEGKRTVVGGGAGYERRLVEGDLRAEYKRYSEYHHQQQQGLGGVEKWVSDQRRLSNSGGHHHNHRHTTSSPRHSSNGGLSRPSASTTHHARAPPQQRGKIMVEKARHQARNQPKLSQENFKELFNSLESTVSHHLKEMSTLPRRSSSEGGEPIWAKLIDKGLLEPLSESTPQFIPQKSSSD